MPDVNSLILEVKSDSVERGSDRLDHLTRSASKAERAQRSFATTTTATTAATSKSATATGTAATATAGLSKAQTTAAATTTATATATKGYAVAQGQAAAATTTAATATKAANVAATGLLATMTKLLAPLLAILAPIAALKGLVTTASGLESSLSGVRAVTQATAEEMQELEAVARTLGESTVFSAQEAADGMRFLGQAGFETNEIIAAMPGLLDLAAAGQLDLAQASDIASNILSGFQLAASESGRVSDVLAQAAASANTNIEQLGSAMSFVAPISASLGIEVEETAAAIGVLSDAGIQGQRAGTGLRTVLASLSKITPQAEAELDKMGLSVLDVNPSLNSLTEIAENLAAAGLDASEAFQIFGSEGAPAILALTANVDRLGELNNELENAGGAAATMSGILSDNLGGSLKQLGSAFSEMFLSVNDASGALGIIRGVVDFVTEGIRDLNLIIKSGVIQDEIKSWLVAFEGWGDDVSGVLDWVGGLFESSPLDWAASVFDFIQETRKIIKILPALVRAQIQRVGVEIGAVSLYAEAAFGAVWEIAKVQFNAIIETAKAAGRAIGAALNPFDDTGFTEAFKQGIADQVRITQEAISGLTDVYTQAERDIQATREARLAAIGDIDEEFKSVVDRVNELTLTSTKLTEAYKREKEARDAARATPEALPPRPATSDEPTTGGTATALPGESLLDEFGGAPVGIFERLRLEETAIQESYDKRREMILEAEQVTEEERTALLVELENQRNQLLSDIQQQRFDARLEQANNFFGNFAALSRSSNKELAGIGKAALKVQKGIAIAQATMKTYESATSAYASLASIPYIGPALGAAAAAAAIAAGLANVAAITSAGNNVGNFATGGIVPGTSFSGDALTANVNSAEMILNRQQQSRLFNIANGAATGGQRVVVNVTNNNTETVVRERTDGDGGTVVDIETRVARQVENRLVDGIATRTGAVNSAMERQFVRRTNS